MLLKKDGLKYTVDDLSSNLSISKITIYKYLTNKENITIQLYEKIYSDLIFKICKLSDNIDLNIVLKILDDEIYFKQ